MKLKKRTYTKEFTEADKHEIMRSAIRSNVGKYRFFATLYDNAKWSAQQEGIDMPTVIKESIRQYGWNYIRRWVKTVLAKNNLQASEDEMWTWFEHVVGEEEMIAFVTHMLD